MRKVFTTLLFTFLFFSNGFSQNQYPFKWLHPLPQGNSINWIQRFDKDNWYACGESGVFLKTTDGGVTWDITTFITESGALPSLNDGHFFNLNTGYLCGSSGRVYKTTNAAQTWDTITAINSGIRWNDMHWLNSNTGFVSGTSAGTLARTTNGGLNWNKFVNLPTNNNYSVYSIDTSRIIVGGNDGKIYRTTNAGLQWVLINSGTNNAIYKLNFIDDNTGYLCGSSLNGLTIRYTSNFGESWSDMSGNIIGSIPFYDIDFRTIPSVGSYVYLSGDKKYIFRSLVGSSVWDTLNVLESGQSIVGNYLTADISITGDTMLAAGREGLVNARFSENNRHLFTHYIKVENLKDIWGDNKSGKIIAVGNTDTYDNQIMVSTDYGTNWDIANYNVGDSGSLNSICMINSLTGYVAGDQGLISKTTDGGLNWFVPSLPDFNSIRIETICFTDENTGYAYGWGGLKTTNGGISWKQISTGHGNDPIRSTSFISSLTGWTAGLYGKIFKTTDGGNSFAQQNADVGNDAFSCIKMINEYNGFLITDDEVRKTTDGGTHWDTVHMPATGFQWYTSLDFFDENNGMISTYYGKVFKTTDAGLSWSYYYYATATTLYNSYLRMVSPDSAYLCGSESAILRYSDFTTNIISHTYNIPGDYYLDQNYPNPFNPVTTIRFALKKPGTVSVKIFDVTGKEIMKLINNERLNAGEFSFRFDGSGLTSGIYFYTLLVDGKSILTKKMVLVK